MAPQRKRQRLSKGDSHESPPNAAAQVKTALEDSEDDLTHEKKQEPRKTLFVRGLPPTVTTEILTEYFSESFPLKHATVVLDPETKNSKGFGFVTFADVEDAQRAKEELHNSVLEGRKIKLDVAEPRRRDSASENGPDALKRPTLAANLERKKQQAEARQPPPKLIVRNLPWSMSEPDQLAALFRSFGKVKHATIPKKKAGLLAGFGFVVLRGRRNAERALQAINGKEIDGRVLAVDWAVEKQVWEDAQNQEDSPKVIQSDAQDEDDPDDDLALASDPESAEDSTTGSDKEDNSTDDADGDMDNDDWEDGEDDEDRDARPEDYSGTLFIRNLPYTSSDDTLFAQFRTFGPLKYARVVMDHVTDRPRGTGFICFYNKADAEKCLREAPRTQTSYASAASDSIIHSVLENEALDPTGRYTMDGRILHIARAVDRTEAAQLTEKGIVFRNDREKDRRRLYLLSEGTIPSNSPLYNLLAPSEIAMREASAKQRKTLIQSNPALNLSLTRLSIRNIPRSVTSKDLKALAREAVVGFANDVKEGRRSPLSKEELDRGGEEMKAAEKQRKIKGKGIVKQAKVVFEGREGSKVPEKSGAGRSRGYGFIEYSSHRWALMGLRWLNGHPVGYQVNEDSRKGAAENKSGEKKKRLIVEFAIENAQVVARRREREAKARDRTEATSESKEKASGMERMGKTQDRKKTDKSSQSSGGRKEKKENSSNAPDRSGGAKVEDKTKLAKRERIIARKRKMRRARKGGS